MAQKHELFEFNAPKYVDFSKGIPEDTDDSYFEIAPEPSEIKEKVDATEQLENASTSKETLENAATHTKIEELPAPMEESGASLPSTEQPTSVHDSEETHTSREEQPTFLPGSEEPEKPLEAAEETSDSEEPLGVTEQLPAGSTGGEVQSASKGKRRGRSSSVGVRQSPRLIAISKALRRSGTRSSLGRVQISTSRTQDNQVKKVQPQRRGNRRVSGVSVISQEDKVELETVATFHQKITKNKKKKETPGHRQPLKATKTQEFHFATDQRLRKHQEEDPAPAPAPSTLRPARSGPTRPQEFSFATDARLKAKEPVKGEDNEAAVEFAKSLRSSSTTSLNKNAAGGRGPTIPQPFNLSEPRKPQTEEPKKFVSLAEMNYEFYVKTPLRFRSKRAGSTELSEETSKKPRGPTVPTTPNLATGRRRRSLSVMTHEERERQEFEEAQKHAFKAKPVNKKVFESPANICKVEKKLPTVPAPFDITDSKKAPILSESLTEGMDSTDKISVSLLPYGGIAVQGKRHTTKIQPFSFDSRDKAKMKKKQEKIQKVLEEEKSLAEFHARPMPVFEDGVHGLPPKKPLTPTQAKPFTMRVDQRGTAKQEKFKQQLEEEAQKEAEQRLFHAQGDEVVHKMPFIPGKSKKPLTEISNISLKTELRASERSDFDQHLKEVEEEMMAAKRQEEECRAAEELAEVARLRQEAVHKAQPMPNYKPMTIQPASQPPTHPESPKFATTSRLRSRSRANSTFSL